MLTTHNILGDLSEGSSDALEFDDMPGKPVLKTTGNPEVTTTKKGPIVDKDQCPQSGSSRVGCTSGEFLDDNQMKSEFDDVIVATFKLVYCRLPMYIHA